KSSRTCSLNALRTSGRLMVRTATLPLSSERTTAASPELNLSAMVGGLAFFQEGLDALARVFALQESGERVALVLQPTRKRLFEGSEHRGFGFPHREGRLGRDFPGKTLRLIQE